MTVAAFLGIITLISKLEPIAIPAIEALIQKMQGMTPEQIAALTKSINDTTIQEADAELAKLPPKV